MSDDFIKFKRNHIEFLKESIQYFKSGNKFEREKFVVKQLLNALRITFKENEIIKANEPADVAFRNARFQVKEIFDDGRERLSEYINALTIAEKAASYDELYESYDIAIISFADVVANCRRYAEGLIDKSKYGIREVKNLDLLCYFNRQDYFIKPVNNIQTDMLEFRSLSVVSSRYCAVVYAKSAAPQLLIANIKKVFNYNCI